MVDPEGLERLRRQAQEALTRYEAAIREAGDAPRFVPIGGLTNQLGNWEVANGDNHKAALGAGQVVAGGPLPEAPRATGDIAWEGGERLSVPLLSANQALAQLRAAGAGDCADCTPLTVTGARLTTVRISTTRGWAAVPAWEYTVAGTSVRLTQVAVADSAIVTVTPPSWDPYNAPGGLAIESATTTRSGTQLTVTFTGAPGPASQPCGADYGAEVVESAHAIVVIVTEHRHAKDEVCPAIGARREAVAQLAQPLGERAVLEVQQGMPVFVTIAE